MIRITVLTRGGLSVYGGIYDPHRDEAVVQTRDGETVAVTIEYPSPPSAVTTTGTGIVTTTPAVSGNLLTLTLSGAQDDSRLDVLATVGNEIRLIRIRARSQTMIDRYLFGPDLIGT